MQVAVIAKQFAILQNALKFEALYLLSSIMSNKYSVCDFLPFMPLKSIFVYIVHSMLCSKKYVVCFYVTIEL